MPFHPIQYTYETNAGRHRNDFQRIVALWLSACVVGLNGLGLNDDGGVAALNTLGLRGDSAGEIATLQYQRTNTTKKYYFSHSVNTI